LYSIEKPERRKARLSFTPELGIKYVFRDTIIPDD
jgi:hypothetical protein